MWNQAWFSTQRSANGLLRYARQSLFAPLYLEYYRETGQAEYFELDTERKQAFGLNGCLVRLQEDGLHIAARYQRRSLTLATSDGARHKIALQEGQAVVSLQELAPRYVCR